MVNMVQRLARCKAYRDEALKQPLANRLYIEDLNLSISLFEEMINKKTEILVQEGWSDDE